MTDFEENLDAYVIRKAKLDNRLLKIKQKTVVPFLICDVIGAKTTNGDIFSILRGKLEYECRLCLLCGRIMGFVSKHTRFNTYLLEDGTAIIELTVFKTLKQKKKTNSNSTFNSIRFYHKPERLGPLRDMLKSAEKIPESTNITIGTALIVLGRISSSYGKIRIIGQSLFPYKGANRDMEVAFKDYLIRCYTEKSIE